MLLVLLTLLVASAGLIYLWLGHKFSYWSRRNVPHEQPVLLLGNMLGIGTKYHWKDIDKRIYERFKRSGAPFVGYYAFMSKAVMLLDLELIKQVMVKDFAYFSDRGLFNNVRDDPLTGNLLFLDGEPWRELRHKLSPVFTTGRMRYMFPTVVTVGQQLVDACKQLMTNDVKSIELEAKEICARYTTDVIGTCAFGIECNSLRNPNAEFRRMGRSIMEEPRQSSFVQAFMFSNPDLARKLRIKMFTDESSEFFMNAVRETVAYREKHEVKRNDFMDLLIELKQKRDRLLAAADVGIDDALSNGLTLEQVAAQAMVFFLAGFETSSTTMSFCMYELALNPNVQEQLRAELLQVLAKYNGEISYESVKEMHYLEQVIAETLRKYSVLPHIVRQTVNDYHVPGTDFVLERGTRILIPVDALHNDALLYPEPQKFDPERFTAEQVAQRHSAAYIPFGDGQRNCIGMRFGKLQVQIGMIMLLQHYRISTTEKTQIPLRFSKQNFLVATESGIYLKLERLDKAGK